MNEPAAGAELEFAGLEVNVSRWGSKSTNIHSKPAAFFVDGAAYDGCPQAFPLVARSGLGVDQERVHAVPGDINHPDKKAVGANRHPTE